MEAWIVAYLLAVAALGLATIARVYLGLLRTRAANLRRVARKRRFEAVPTDTPVNNPSTVARDRAVESIERQFTVTRLIFVPLVLVLTLIGMGLPFLNRVPATFVSIFLTTVTILGGVAARPFLENAIAGVVVSLSRLINLGDTVRLDGVYGTVEDITATHTTIKLWDWRRHVVPNTRMLQMSLINYSLFDRYIWASVDVWVAYDVDLDRVKEVAVRYAKESEHFSGSEEPEFWVLELGKDGVRCMVAAWTNLPSSAWMLQHDIRHGIAKFFREEGIRAAVHHVGVDERATTAQLGAHITAHQSEAAHAARAHH